MPLRAARNGPVRGLREARLPGAVSRVLSAFFCVALILTAGTGNPVGAAGPAAPVAVEAPDVSIQRIDSIDWRPDGASVVLVLRIGNHKGATLPLQALHFQCLFGDTAVALGESLAAVDIPANGSALVPVRLDIDGITVAVLGAAVSSGTPLTYRIEGTAEVGLTGIPIAFVHRGTISFAGPPIPAAPR